MTEKVSLHESGKFAVCTECSPMLSDDDFKNLTTASAPPETKVATHNHTVHDGEEVAEVMDELPTED